MQEGREMGGYEPDLTDLLTESRTIWSPLVIQTGKDGAEAESQEYLQSQG